MTQQLNLSARTGTKTCLALDLSLPKYFEKGYRPISMFLLTLGSTFTLGFYSRFDKNDSASEFKCSDWN